MKILFIHQYFRTPEEGGGIRSYYMCKALMKQGHQVTVFTAHNKKKYLVKNIDGITLHYLPVFYENKLGFVGRSYSFLKFLFLTTFYALRLAKPDICYASSSPLTVGVIAIALKKFKNVPFIFEVMDLWPEAPIQLGYVKNQLLKRLLYWLEIKIYKESQLVVAASPGMSDKIEQVVPKKEVLTIPNMADCDFFHSKPKDPSLLKKFGVENKLVCCYTGAIGFSNNLEVLVPIAEYLKKNKDTRIHFLIVGEGSSLSKLKSSSESLLLDNISFLGHLDKEQIREIYNVSDINLVIFNSHPILETNSPNKFFDGLAAGLPSIINIRGWIAEICEENNCGMYANSANPMEFVKKMNIFQDKELWNTYSKNARQLAEKKFSKEILLKQFTDRITRGK